MSGLPKSYKFRGKRIPIHWYSDLIPYNRGECIAATSYPRTEGTDTAFGLQINCDGTSIEMSKKCDDTGVVLLHEFLHGVEEQASFRQCYDAKQREHMITVFSIGIAQLLRENKWLAEFVIKNDGAVE